MNAYTYVYIYIMDLCIVYTVTMLRCFSLSHNGNCMVLYVLDWCYEFMISFSFQVVTNRETQETLLCIAFVFEVSTSEHGAQYHVYRLIKD